MQYLERTMTTSVFNMNPMRGTRAMALLLILAACGSDDEQEISNGETVESGDRDRRELPNGGDAGSDTGSSGDAASDSVAADAGVADTCATSQNCSETMVCVDGLCRTSCEPYPLTPFLDPEDGESNRRWLENGCPHSRDWAYGCLAYVEDNSVLLSEAVPGYCDRRTRATAVGELNSSCIDDNQCNPDLVCAGPEGAAVCIKLCRPFSGSAPSDCQSGAMCSPVDLPGVGTTQAFGVCQTPDTAASQGDVCGAGEIYCSDDDTLCIGDVGGESLSCQRLCQLGVESTCPEGSSCTNEGVGFDGPQPNWLAVCQ